VLSYDRIYSLASRHSNIYFFIFIYEFFDCEMAINSSSISFIYSNKGSSQLVHDGFVFKLNKRTSTKIYWKCTVTSCTAHIHTDTNNNLLNATSEHNHLLEPENLKVKQFRTILKERVINETVPIQKIYDEEIAKANFSSELLASVPLAHRIRMTLIVQFSNISLCFFLFRTRTESGTKKINPNITYIKFIRYS
jgi:hypothetical protein